MSALVVLDSTHPSGRLADPQQPLLRATDMGITRGDGVFETLLARGISARNVNAHIQRLLRSAEHLSLTPIPAPEHWENAIDLALNAHLQNPELRGTPREAVATAVRVVAVHSFTPQTPPSCWVSTSPAPPPPQQPLRVATLTRGYSWNLDEAPWLLLGVKSLSFGVNMAALRHARERGFDDALFLSTEGYVLEGATSSLIVADTIGGRVRLRTPSHRAGVLPGTTQAALFELAQALQWRTEYAALTKKDILTSEGAWLVSSVRGPVAVCQIDDEPLPVVDVGPTMRELFEAIT